MPLLVTGAFGTGTVGLAMEDEPRVLTKEVVIEAPLEEVWRTWTTREGLTCVSSKSNVELRVDGPYEWFLDLPADSRGRRGGEGARILAFLPNRMLAFDWTFPPSVPTLRESDARTQVVVMFDAVDTGTHLLFTQHGWQEGEDWDAGYEYFDEAWDYVLRKMKSCLEG